MPIYEKCFSYFFGTFKHLYEAYKILSSFYLTFEYSHFSVSHVSGLSFCSLFLRPLFSTSPSVFSILRLGVSMWQVHPWLREVDPKAAAAYAREILFTTHQSHFIPIHTTKE
eukprot:GHVT01084569.1.p1 GENE.GHVT01084569.1~~GHVT01084569.1.p1  ORF type:complete len:112 (-),score=3.04 GHVT01084569.1:1431-1766(-)